MENRAVLKTNEILYLPVDAIKPNPYQPRKFFERANLLDLCNSIKQYGVMQPVSVRLINGYTYELVAGERRLRATKMAGIKTIPVIIVDICDLDSAVIALIENIQRQDLNFLEEAEGLKGLMLDYGFTQEQLAEKVGKSQSAIANKIRILRLNKDVLDKLLENDLTERHARALLRLTDEADQLDAVEKIIRGGLTVQKTEDLVENIISVSVLGKKYKPTQKIKRYIKDIKIFTNTIKQSVDILKGSGVNVEFVTEEHEDSCEILISVLYK